MSRIELFEGKLVPLKLTDNQSSVILSLLLFFSNICLFLTKGRDVVVIVNLLVIIFVVNLILVFKFDFLQYFQN